MQNYFKKTILVFFFGFFVVIIFFSRMSPAGAVNVVEASFWDKVIGIVKINPLRVSISAPAEVELEKGFKVEVVVKNRGENRISNVRVEIFISKDLILVNKNSSKKIGSIQGNKTKNISWQIKGTEIGNFSISAKAYAEIEGDAISAQGNTVIVTVVEKSLPPGKPFNFLQRFFNILAKWFS